MKVAKAALNVVAQDTTKYQFRENPEFRIVLDSLFGSDTMEDIDEMPVASTAATIDSPPGEYDIILIGGTDNNYELNLINGVLTILEPLV